MPQINLYIYIFTFLLGLCLGSFLNVIIYRLPLKKSLVLPPSSCPSCGKKLGVLELIPLVGFLFLKGRCRSCQAKISIQYPLVELTTGAAFAFVYYRFSLTTNTLFYFTFIYLLLAVALIDLKYRIVPNQLVLAGGIIAIIFHLPALLANWFSLPGYFLLTRTPLDSLYGFLLGSVIFFLIIVISKGGMGGGDLKLVAMIGLYLGFRGTAMMMLLGFVAGALVGVYFMVSGKLTRKDALPFAPFLSLAALIELFLGEEIWHWYINLFL